MKRRFMLAGLFYFCPWLLPVSAEIVQVRVERIVSGANRPAMTPMWVGLHNGSFDFFDSGQPATSEVEAIAELGDLTALRSQFIGHGFDAVAGFMPLTQENPSAEVTLDVDPFTQRYLSFAAMTLPSNDTFYGNDNPSQYAVFDEQGKISPLEILLTKTEWWDAGTEVNDRTASGGAAFIMGADATAGADENGVITPFAELSFYNGATLVNGESFDTLPQATDEFEPMVRITVVPEPSSFAVTVAAALMALAARRSRPSSK